MTKKLFSLVAVVSFSSSLWAVDASVLSEQRIVTIGGVTAESLYKSLVAQGVQEEFPGELPTPPGQEPMTTYSRVSLGNLTCDLNSGRDLNGVWTGYFCKIRL